MHQVNTTFEGADNPSEPRRGREALRRVARLGGRAVQIGVVAAAGLAGWLAVEQLAVPQVAGVVAAAAPMGPWPAEFAEQTTSWESVTLTEQRDGAAYYTTSRDATTDRSRITYFSDGVANSVVEIAGTEAWELRSGWSEWERVVDQNVTIHVQIGLGSLEPRHITSVIPASVEPFVTVASEASDVSTMRFVVEIDVAEFRKADVVEFARWAQSEGIDGAPLFDADPIEWTFDVRDDGYIVRWDGDAGVIQTWTDNPTDLSFESPLQPRTDD